VHYAECRGPLGGAALELTPEEREKIYIEEKARLEIRQQWEASTAKAGTPTVPVVIKTRPSDGIAAVLSLFIPGAGQMYKGRLGQGFLWLGATVVGYLLLILPGLAIHFICIWAAYATTPVES
jgi:TM2 domain-containing membrane protein YozV